VSAAPSSLKASISASGYYYDELLTQTWVPAAVSTAMAGQLSALDSAAVKVIGTGTGTSTNAAPMKTALGLGAMVGVGAGVLAAL
jgi:hypothetical protein